jgi:LacI family transcriptional regulator
MARNRGVPHVALLVETSRGYGRSLIEGIAQYVREHGSWSIQFEERDLEDPPPRWLAGWRGDGIIARSATDALAKAVRAIGVPLVELHYREPDGIDVGCDHDAVGCMAAEHLLDRGLRQFAFFAFGEVRWIRLRREAFVRVLAAAGHSCKVYQPPLSRRVVLPHWEESQRPHVARWVGGLPRPLGILCASDLHALHVLDACRDLGIQIPEQIAVLGVDNDAVICSVINPLLSSIDLNSRRIGYEAAALLTRRMTGRSLRSKPLSIPPSHVVTRRSTDVLAIDDADVAQAIGLIRQRAGKGICVSEVAAGVGLSRRVLERRFRQWLRRSPKAEIVRVQIEAAKMLLAQSELSIEAIARQCGGASFKYFGQLFRRETGLTPRAFRKARRVMAARNASEDPPL